MGNNRPVSKSSKYTRDIIIVSIFTVVSAALSLIKIPSPAGSIALDSSPGFFVAGYFSPILGAIVGALGHLASAATGGFPFSFLHIYVSIEMFLWCFIFGFFLKKINKKYAIYFAALIAWVLNSFVGPILLIITPFANLQSEIAFGLIPFLMLASALNIILASIAVKFISKIDIQDI